VITWSWDPNCPICDEVTISRDGVVVASVPGDQGEFRERCIDIGGGQHEYCVECPDPTGLGEPVKECCTVICQELCNCPGAGLDIMTSRLVHLIEVPGFGIINANLQGTTVVSREDPFIDPATGLCCIKTKIERMYLTGTDPLAGPVVITLNPCKPSVGTICQKVKGSNCFPALSCFDIYIRVELPALGLVLVNCEPINMCCEINSLPPFGCNYAITNDPISLYREIVDATDPCRSVCDLPENARPDPVAFINEATHIPGEPDPNCGCYPPAGTDIMDSNLWHEIEIFGIDNVVCRAALRGQVEVERGDPVKDPATGICSIPTKMIALDLTGTDPACGNVTIALNTRRESTGFIREREPGTCFPADSSFNVFIEVHVERDGETMTFVNCEPAVMEAVITSIPPYNAVYNIRAEGLELFLQDPAGPDVCTLDPRPAPAARIGRALHVPRDLCSCFGEGVDVMNSVLVHDLVLPGLPSVDSCNEPFRGRIEVVRGTPYLDDNGHCTVDTEIVALSLTSNDPDCGPVVIRLNPDEMSGGFIKQLSTDSCFPAQSCFQVFVEVEVQGVVLRNCEPAIMCSEIDAVPPFGQFYRLKFGDDVQLYKPGECDLPPSERPAPTGVIVQLEHRPEPPCGLDATCETVDGHYQITLIPDPGNDECCPEFVVTRDDGVEIPASATSALVFTDPDPCVDLGPRTYTVRCKDPNIVTNPEKVEVTCQDCRPPVNWKPCDTDGSGNLDLTDVIAYLNFSFLGTFAPGCMGALDCDGSGGLDLTDAIQSLNYQFVTGVAPSHPAFFNCYPFTQKVDGSGDPCEVSEGCQ